MALHPFFSNVERYPASEGLKPGLGLMWGLLRGVPELIEQSQRQGQPWVYMDHGYFKSGHYSGYYRMTLNDFQKREVTECKPDRWQALGVSLKPWRKGRDVVVCPSSDHFNKLFGLENWEAETVSKLKTLTDRPIVVRRKTDRDAFEKSIANAHAVVTAASLAAVSAVAHGVPVFVSKASAAAPVGLTDLSKIEEPIYPDREPWAWSLAYGQYRKEEFDEGLRNVSDPYLCGL